MMAYKPKGQEAGRNEVKVGERERKGGSIQPNKERNSISQIVIPAPCYFGKIPVVIETRLFEVYALRKFVCCWCQNYLRALHITS